MLPTAFWKWASLENHRYLVFHLGNLTSPVGRSVSQHHHQTAWQRRATASVRRFRDGDGLGNGGVPRCQGNGNGLCNGEYIFGKPQGRLHHILYVISELEANIISYHPIIQWIAHSIFPIIWSDSLFSRFCGSSLLGGIPFSHPVSTLLQPEVLFLTNSSGCHERCGGVSIMCSLSSSSTGSL